MDLERAAQTGSVTAGADRMRYILHSSKRQTIGLTEYMLAAYNIDPAAVYISGYSGGGETLSLVLSEQGGNRQSGSS